MRKNQKIREFLTATCQERKTMNQFSFGSLYVKLDPDSPVKGVEFDERVYLSIYNPHTDTDMRFSVPVASVEFTENALAESTNKSN